MKSLSVVVTLALLVMANQLAARMRKSGSLPAANVSGQSSALTPGAASGLLPEESLTPR